MILLILALLLLGSALGLGLGRMLSTRLIGFGAALISAGAAVLAALGQWTIAADGMLVLLRLETLEYSLMLFPAAPERALAVLLLGASAAIFLLLSIAIAPAIREFGAIFGWALLALAATFLSLLTPITSALLPLAWAVAAIGGYSAVRASGALNQDERAPQSLILGVLGAAALFGAQAGATTALLGAELPPWLSALALLVAVLAAGGVPPLSGARAEAPHVPAPLGAFLYAVIQPTLTLGALLRFVTALPILPTSWSVVGCGGWGAWCARRCGRRATGAATARGAGHGWPASRRR
ncbi:MAG: hypothetical protein HC822_11930, partial [Oscillochloris sp.]|nr:hypothetical protein [Oscillochloris sp.]